MADTKGGFPFWEVRFDEQGNIVNDGADHLIEEIAAKNLTDLFVFSHGWNNSPAYALGLNDMIFGQMRDVINDPNFAGKRKRDFTIGAVGVIWPSMKWLDDGTDDSEAVAAAAAGDVDTSDKALILNMKSMYTRPDQQAAIERMAELIDEQPQEDEKVEEFRTLLKKLSEEFDDAASSTPRAEDDLAAVMFQEETPAREVFETIAENVAGPADNDQGGAADFGGAAGFNPFRKIWEGAKEAARQATYWTMKRRAGVVGQKGLGPLIDQVHKAAENVKIHLMGHSFGARLVSFALTGVKSDPSPVKSLTMLQGAFSHFAFTASLPFDPGRSGALAGWQKQVHGPILITHSKLDQAVGTFYPLAALAGLDDAAEAGQLMDRWQGMGYDGTREVNAASLDLGPAYTMAYTFQPGSFYNLDANHVITKGKFPAGAHGDIVHPHVAWATLAAAGIV